MAATTIYVPANCTVFDLMTEVMRAIFGVEIDLTHTRSVEGIALAMLLDAVETEAGKNAIADFAWAHNIAIDELDSVACAIMDTLDCTAEAAQGLREWVFDGISDSKLSIEQLRADLEQFGAWYPDFESLEEDGYTTRDGALYEKQLDSAPVPCEADVWQDVAFGYFVMFH